MSVEKWVHKLEKICMPARIEVCLAHHEITIIVLRDQLLTVMEILKKHEHADFSQLIDVCGVDYLQYGVSDWETTAATDNGFSRGVATQPSDLKTPARFAVVYHLLSIAQNRRIRVKVFLDEHDMMIPSVHHIWKAADWFEREAYDLYGIFFSDHPDLRRILTDYGFIGHPFRKDFPLSGHVEVRYDAAQQKVVYEPVDIEPRITVPKVIRHDNRYVDKQEKTS